jgi:alkaline phosphatase D
VDAPIETFDDNGVGRETNNLLAIESLRGYRAIRWGRHLDLILTDQHSYRSEDPLLRAEAKVLLSDDFPDWISENAATVLDAGRTYDGGHPPEFIQLGAQQMQNFRQHSPPQAILGVEQKRWFLDRLKLSTATWKLWGDTEGTFEWRADLQNLPAGFGKTWPSSDYATMASQDHSNAMVERAEIYDFVRANSITGFGIVAGDRHSFWAGLAAPALPPKGFDPVGVAFVAGSISSPGLVEAYEHKITSGHLLYPLYFRQQPGEAKPQAGVNLLLLHGVRSALEYSKTGDVEAARRLTNPELAPHLAFLDLAGHGYALARVSADLMECEFVCIERPLERAGGVDGGPLRYRVVHRANLWKPGQRPTLAREVVEGRADLCI